MTKSDPVSNGNFKVPCILGNALPEITFSLKRSHISGMGRTRSQKPECSFQKGVPILMIFVQILLRLCITVPSPELLCVSGWGDFRYRRGCEQWRSRSAAIEVGCDCVHTPEAFQVGWFPACGKSFKLSLGWEEWPDNVPPPRPAGIEDPCITKRANANKTERKNAKSINRGSVGPKRANANKTER